MTDEYPKDLHEIKSSLHDELREMRAEQKVSCDRNAKAHERLISSTQRLHGDRRTIIAVMTVLGVIFGGSGVWAYGVIQAVADDAHIAATVAAGNSARGKEG